MGYQSRIRRRETDVTEDDFCGLRGFYFNGNDDGNPVNQSALALWNDFVPLYPSDILQIFQSWIPNDIRIKMDLACSGNMRLSLKAYDGSIEDGLLQLKLSKPMEIIESFFEVKEDYKNHRLGTAWFSAVVELHAALGFDRFTFIAGRQDGAHAWARKWAYIDFEKTIDAELSHLRHRLGLRIEAAIEAGAISLEEGRKLKGYARLQNPDDLCRFCEEEIVLPDFFIPEKEDVSRHYTVQSLKELAVDNRHFMDRDKPAVFANAEGFKLKRMWDASVCCGKPLSFQRYALQLESYHAYIDFSDPVQMQKTGKKLGGWKFGDVTDAGWNFQTQYENVAAVRLVV